MAQGEDSQTNEQNSFTITFQTRYPKAFAQDACGRLWRFFLHRARPEIVMGTHLGLEGFNLEDYRLHQLFIAARKADLLRAAQRTCRATMIEDVVAKSKVRASCLELL